MPYRVEESQNNRAGCKNKECKDAGVKIMKGELRFGSLFTIKEHQSWAYKHWGCVTPAQIENLIEESGGDTEMVDGYDELPEELQEKVQYALANGHVPDEDWKGDVECNRPGAKGFRKKVQTPKKKKGKKADENDAGAESPEQKPKKKRGRAAKEVDEEEEAPAPKKARGKSKKAAVKEASESEVEEPKPKVKKVAKSKKASVNKDISEDEAEVEAPKPKRGKKKAAAPDVEEKKAVPQKRGRKKKTTAEDD